MLNVSDATKQAYKDFGASRSIVITIYTSVNNPIVLTNDDIAVNTLSVEEILESSDNLTFTGCNASVLKFKSVNTLDDILGKKVTVTVTTGSTETIPLFTGYIDSAKNTSYMKASMEIVAYDKLYQINNVDYKSWYDSLFISRSSVTMKQLRDNFFTRAGIEQEETILPNDSITIKKTIDSQNILGNNILKWICQLNGRYGRIGRDGKFQYVNLDGSSLYPQLTLYPSNDIYPGMNTNFESVNFAQYKMDSISFEKYATHVIDGVQLIGKDNSVVASAGESTKTNILNINGNPFIYEKTQTQLNNIARRIYNAVSNCSYVPLSLEMIGLPYVECGDYVRVAIIDRQLNTFILHRTISGEQALNDRIETKGDEYLPLFKPNVDNKINEVVDEAREAAKRQLTDYDIMVREMNNLAINAMGAYQDYEDVESGGRYYYLSNMPITKRSDGKCVFDDLAVVFKTTGTGFFVSRPVTTPGSERIWENGYDAQTGTLLINMLYTIGLHAEWIVTGELTVGGSNVNPSNPTIRVLDENDDPICYINENGITMYQGYIQSPDYAEETPAGTFSHSGMMIDVNNSAIKSPYFALNNNGAYLKGEIQADSGQIGGATITQDAITVRGDIELYNGSGTSFDFAPYDYRLSEDFVLTFYNENESMTVTINQYMHGSSTPTLIETISVPADTETTSTVTLNHLIGQIDGDFYRISATATGTWTAIIDDAILAYMGVGGFLGFLQGIFEGHIDANGKLDGELKGKFDCDSGKVDNIEFYNNHVNVEDAFDMILTDSTTPSEIGYFHVSPNDHATMSLKNQENVSTGVKEGLTFYTRHGYVDSSYNIHNRPTIRREFLNSDTGNTQLDDVLWDSAIKFSAVDDIQPGDPMPYDTLLYIVYE